MDSSHSTGTNLFQGQFIFLHSGQPTDFKIECDALSDEDLKSLAKVVARHIMFAEVVGIPRGGERFAEALKAHRIAGSGVVLIVDDVLTTGSSFRSIRSQIAKQFPGHSVAGVCIFCRRPAARPEWVRSIFDMSLEY